MLAAVPLATQQVPTFASSTRLVTVAVSVMKDGRPVLGLTRNDFEIRSDGQVVPIAQFFSDTGPITAAVLLDASGSMNVNAAMAPAAMAARALIGDLVSGVDRAGVFTFDRVLTTRQAITPVGPAHHDALTGTRAFGSTSLYDAVLATSQTLAADGAARRAVVVFTDGVDTSSLQQPGDVRTHAAAIDVPVYILAIVSAHHAHEARTRGLSGAQPLATLAAGTGGRLFTVSSGTSLQEARAMIVSTLRQHYLLALVPSDTPGWHSLSVRTRQNHIVHARAGYSVSSQLTQS
jgi:Ca-activated chloride channel family protein